MTTVTSAVGAFVLALAAAAAEQPVPAPPPAPAQAPASAPVEKPDPSKDGVPLEALGGWQGSLVYDNDVGVWTVESFKIFPVFGAPEIVGLDDKGRLAIAYSYSGKWYRKDLIEDGKWLGGLEHMDLDPTVPGKELYTGGEKGNLYQVVAHRPGVFSVRYVDSLPGREIHTMIGGDLVPGRQGNELAIFTMPGGLFLVTARNDPAGGLVIEEMKGMEGRIRDAVLLPAPAGAAPRIATVSREGAVRILRFEDGKPAWETVFERPQGFGRIALRRPAPGAPAVLYTCCDDGLVFRHQEKADGAWATEAIYAGPQGTRGVVSGRFDANPEAETVAVFGYGRKVQVLTRGSAGWKVETIFVDREKGHWMCVAELDGRNGTDEIVCSGFTTRVVQLARPPGYGLPGVAVDPDSAPAEGREKGAK